MSGVEVVESDLSLHPRCPHGPALLFRRFVKSEPKLFYACSACRDRKDCTFFLWADEKHVPRSMAWEQEILNFVGNVDHAKLFDDFKEVSRSPVEDRFYCNTCGILGLKGKREWQHKSHAVVCNISDYDLMHPSELLSPLDDPKKEAQFLFSRRTTETLVRILYNLGYRNIISMGTPRIHEFIMNEKVEMHSLLLDIDRRFHMFFGPDQFCWYNSFNHHFFFDAAKDVFEDFLKLPEVALIMDPPFGGRVEPLAHTVTTLSRQYKQYTKVTHSLPVFWIFPYFMEPHLLNSLPNFKMLDYKVDYDNHPLFRDDPKGRKHGSPVRIFTNVDPKCIVLPKEEGYKFCESCSCWVSSENRHCNACGYCTSKDGRTYVHCDICGRCTKPTWKHCNACQRCAQVDHKCGELPFIQICFHCHERGHKKRECPKINATARHRKRKAVSPQKIKKRKKILQNADKLVCK